MKKLMIALAAVAMAAGVQAATANWNSGPLFAAKDATGGWDTSKGAVANSMLVTISAYYLTDDIEGQTAAQKFAALAGKSQAELLQYITDNELALTGSAQNKNASTGNLQASAVFKDESVSAGTTYYAILTAEYTDATYGDMYMAATAQAIVSSQGTGTAANIFGGTTSGGVRDWQAVPEPTSGLLLLLGVAGLALRRRRA